MKHTLLMAMYLSLLSLAIPTSATAQVSLRPFTVKDDIETALFGNPYVDSGPSLLRSPDGRFVVAETERGSLADHKIHVEFRVYSTELLRSFVNSNSTAVPEPLWTIADIARSTGNDRGIISQLQWTNDSQGFMFLAYSGSGKVLYLADLRNKLIRAISAKGQDVLNYSVSAIDHYVMAIKSLKDESAVDSEMSTVGTGRALWQLLNAPDYGANRATLWAASGKEAAQPIVNQATKGNYTIYCQFYCPLALAPDGKSALTEIPLSFVPQVWEERYAPPYSGAMQRIRAGAQNLDVPYSRDIISRYTLINIASGISRVLSDAPDPSHAGWLAARTVPVWSPDSTRIAFPGVFPARFQRGASVPCVGVYDVPGAKLQCLEALSHDVSVAPAAGYQRIIDVKFDRGRSDRIRVTALSYPDKRTVDRVYEHKRLGDWSIRPESDKSIGNDLQIWIDESFTQPPRLQAKDPASGKSKTIWDPNPQLASIDNGNVSLYEWKDKSGRVWRAILFLPVGYSAGRHYPLVIQNHGFSVNSYSPGGGYPTVFVARELAASGIAVLHFQDCAGRITPDEGACNVRGYESAVEHLAADGIIDPSRVGLIGFSRTVFYVMKAITSSHLRFAAATIADGIDLGYSQHLLAGPQGSTDEDLPMIGASPIGSGLLQWFKESPEFNLDKVKTPLRVVALGSPLQLISMWEPYEILSELGRPVDLIQIRSAEHILTNPDARLASQGGSVDWMRFWLQGYEDRDPSKAEQYRRWEALCDAQKRNGDKSSACVPSRTALP